MYQDLYLIREHAFGFESNASKKSYDNENKPVQIYIWNIDKNS